MNRNNDNNSQEEGVNSSHDTQTLDLDVNTLTPANELTEQEEIRLQKAEERVEKGFVEQGSALADIRDGKLYKAKYKSFEAYCQERWGIRKAYANRLIDAWKTCIELVTIGATSGDLPSCEGQARALRVLSTPEEKAEAMRQAREKAGDKPVTAKIVREVVENKKAGKGRAIPKQAVAQPELEPERETALDSGAGETEADTAYMNMEAAYRLDLKKVKKLDDGQKKDWSKLLNDIVAVLGNLGVQIG